MKSWVNYLRFFCYRLFSFHLVKVRRRKAFCDFFCSLAQKLLKLKHFFMHSLQLLPPRSFWWYFVSRFVALRITRNSIYCELIIFHLCCWKWTCITSNGKILSIKRLNFNESLFRHCMHEVSAFFSCVKTFVYPQFLGDVKMPVIAHLTFCIVNGKWEYFDGRKLSRSFTVLSLRVCYLKEREVILIFSCGFKFFFLQRNFKFHKDWDKVSTQKANWWLFSRFVSRKVLLLLKSFKIRAWTLPLYTTFYSDWQW